MVLSLWTIDCMAILLHLLHNNVESEDWHWPLSCCLDQTGRHSSYCDAHIDLTVFPPRQPVAHAVYICSWCPTITRSRLPSIAQSCPWLPCSLDCITSSRSPSTSLRHFKTPLRIDLLDGERTSGHWGPGP